MKAFFGLFLMTSLAGCQGANRPMPPARPSLQLEKIQESRLKEAVWKACLPDLELERMDLLKENRPDPKDRRTFRYWSTPKWRGDVATAKLDMAFTFYAKGADQHTIEQSIYGRDSATPIQVTNWGDQLKIQSALWIEQEKLPSHLGIVLIEPSFDAHLYFSQPLEFNQNRPAQPKVDEVAREKCRSICRRLVPALQSIVEEAR